MFCFRMAFESTRLLGRIRGVEKELTAATRQLSSYANSLATGQGQDIMDILNAKVFSGFKKITFFLKC